MAEGRVLRWCLLLAVPLAHGLLGAATPTPPSEATVEQVERVLQPSITFVLDESDQPSEEADWRRLARTVASLEQLECTEDVLGAQVGMVDAAEEGDSLAMAALGTMHFCTLMERSSNVAQEVRGHWATRLEIAFFVSFFFFGRRGLKRIRKKR